MLSSPNKIHGVDLVEINLSSGLSGQAANSFSRDRLGGPFLIEVNMRLLRIIIVNLWPPDLLHLRQVFLGRCFKIYREAIGISQ